MNFKSLLYMLLCSLLLPQLILAQDTLHITSRKYIARNSIMVGLESAGSGLVVRVPVTGQKFTASQIRMEPKVAFFPTRFLALGLSYGYNWRSGNSIPHAEWHQIGGFGRFYLFMQNRDRLLGVDTGHPASRHALFKRSPPGARRFLALSVFPFVEVGLQYSNASQDANGTLTIHPRLNQPLVMLRAGFQARFLKRFYINWMPTLGYLPHQAAGRRLAFGTGAGLEFILPVSNKEAQSVPPVVVMASEPEVPERDANLPEPRVTEAGPMGNDNPKTEQGPDSSYQFRIVAGTSLTYIWDPEKSHFREYTWAANLAFSPIKRLYIGANLMNAWTTSDTSARQHFNLAGAFVQYHIGNQRNVYLTPEVGYYRGDYCTCGEGNPYRRKGINYLAVGGAIGARIYKGLELDLGFMVYQPLLPRTGQGYSYSYTQYVVGLNYEFRLRRR